MSRSFRPSLSSSRISARINVSENLGYILSTYPITIGTPPRDGSLAAGRAESASGPPRPGRCFRDPRIPGPSDAAGADGQVPPRLRGFADRGGPLREAADAPRHARPASEP